VSQTKAQLIDGKAASVEFSAGSVSTPSITFDGDVNTGIFSPAADTIAFAEGGSEAARIDSSGRLLVGTSSARTWGGITGQFLLEGTGYNSSSPFFIANANDNYGAFLTLGKTRGTSVGSNTVVQNNDYLGEVSFAGGDGSTLRQGAGITAYVDGTPGASDMPGRLVFSTTADGASSPTERMRIKSDGVVAINTTTPQGAEFLQVKETFSASNGFCILTEVTGTADKFHLRFLNGNGVVGSIKTSGSTTSFNTSSDYRLKENVILLTGAINRVNQLRVHRFNFIADPDNTVDGFIAHEAQAVVPECITGAKDGVDDNGDPVYQGIDQSKLVPLLTAALQEAIAKIETLEARLTAAGIE